MSAAKQQTQPEEAEDERRDTLVPTSSSGSDRGAGEDLTQMLQQRLAELEQLAHLNKEPKDVTKKVSKMKHRLEAELAAIPDSQPTALRVKAEALAKELAEMYKASLRMQRVADQATAAKSEASDALVKETALRSKLDLLCKELQKRNLEMKMQLAKQQEEQLKSHQGMQATLSSISDGIKSTSEENESLRTECIRLKEQLVDTLNRLQKSAEYNEKIVEVRAAESKLFESHAHQLEERSKIEAHKAALLQQQVDDLIKHNEALSSQAHEFQQKYQQVAATLTSSTDSMKKFSKDMQKQQQLYADAEQQNQLLRKKSALAEKCVTMLQEEKQLAAAAADKKNSVLQALCKKLQAEKKELMQQLQQYAPDSVSQAAAEDVGDAVLVEAGGEEGV